MEDETGQGLGSEETQGQQPDEAVDAPDSGDGTGINPAWNEFLEVIPESLHSQVTPHLSKWDKNYQDGIQKVHSQYEPYKFLVDGQVDPQNIQYSMQVLQAIEEKPEEVLKALQAWLGQEEETEEQGQQNNQTDPELPDITQHPEFQRLQGMSQTMAQILAQQREQEEQQRFDQELDQELSKLSENLGEFDEEWVLQKAMYSDLTLEDAVKEFHKFRDSLLSSARKPGPKIMPSGGSIPSQSDARPADAKERRALVQQMLQQAAEQGN